MPEPAHPFEPEAILAALERHRVRYVLIGGIAAVTRGARLLTEDIDITPARDPANLECLAEALRELDAEIRTDAPQPSSVPLPPDARLLATHEIWNLTTKYGNLDVVLRPGGFERGFEELLPGATLERIGERLQIHVASVDQLIRSKEVSGRPKDLEAVKELRRLPELGGRPLDRGIEL